MKDWVDILLIAELGELDASALRRALEATYAARATHPLPAQLPAPPTEWLSAYRTLRHELDLRAQTLDEAADAIARFINPILNSIIDKTWHSATWSWQ